MSVCERCPLHDPCLIRVPKKTYGDLPPLIGHHCAYYTCPEGLEAAQKALTRGDAQTIVVDGTPMDVYIFGSPSKPTDDPEADVHRYVTDDRRIMATSPDGASVVFIGQTIESLAVAWGPKGL